MPKVSVVVPVYNVEKYLRDAMDSIVNQTFRDIEIICVNDGSTDSSLFILKEYAKEDQRIIILQQERKGAGFARNTGMEIACGEFILFLDADDFFEKQLVEVLYKKCVEHNAEIGFCKADIYNTVTQSYTSAEFTCNINYVPENTVFSYKDNYEYFFQITCNAAWNKMFKRTFIQENKLKFQTIKSANDVFFVNTAMLKAKRIIAYGLVLVHYRIGLKNNLQSEKTKSPLDFYKALSEVKNEMIHSGIFYELKKSFANAVLSNMIYNLNTMQSYEAYKMIYDKLHDKGFEEFFINEFNENDFYTQEDYISYIKIKRFSCEENLFQITKKLEMCNQDLCSRLDSEKMANQALCIELDNLKQHNLDVETGWSFLIGRKITFLPRKIFVAIRCYKDNGINYTAQRLWNKMK